MLTQGVSLSEVPLPLGHSTIAVANDIYAHFTVDVTRDATSKVAELLWGSS